MNKNLNDYKELEVCISCFQGYEAVDFLEKPEINNQWNNLMKITKESSIFQSPEFVMPWYKHHSNEFSPVILLAFQNDILVGLLTLARKIHKNKLDNKLVGAGNFYALYQMWLVLPGMEIVFWKRGIKHLFDEIPGCHINLKSLPSLELCLKLESQKDFKNMTALEKFHNPLLNFQIDGQERIFGKRHFKSKYNRLQRAGKTLFEKIENKEDLNLAFNEIEVFLNLRQGAAFNKEPFPQEFNNRQLYLEWFDKGVLHASLLKLDGNLIGAVVMMEDKGKTVHLAGLITYSPMHAKLSPGLIHLYLLAQKLKEDSFNYLKLSPGYDAYKERFSNSSEDIYELLISPQLHQIIKRKIRIKFREFILKRGIRPMELAVWFSKTKAIIRNKWSNLGSKNKINELTIKEILIFLEEIIKNKIEEGTKLFLANQDLTPLLLVDDKSLECSRWEFLESSLKRLEENQGFLALVQQNQLTICIWADEIIYDLGSLNKFIEEGMIQKVYISRYFKII